MKGIILKIAVEQFGFKDGINFWFRWCFLDPIKIFYWKYIIGKPLCTEHGYFVCKPNCNAQKIYRRKKIIKYEKERHKQIEEESKVIRGSENGICVYCGEEKGTELIDDPNWNTLERWIVCKTCKEVIELQRGITFPFISINKKQEINDKLLKISKETGKEIFVGEINKGNFSSITYGGYYG